ncbi:hypothetical protein QGM71_21300 [Virgibacillus sp. C22-A2]|uniref:Uncharacterized protein n=1 Tax=Virgibacillus tibetensis TaxID=3042313 RepID=A0ABU6KL17_9BACI|nr:hypothetical protein [Virgibacillus sp. C22-A2]
MKKFLSVFLVVMMISTILPNYAYVLADDKEESEVDLLELEDEEFAEWVDEIEASFEDSFEEYYEELFHEYDLLIEESLETIEEEMTSEFIEELTATIVDQDTGEIYEVNTTELQASALPVFVYIVGATVVRTVATRAASSAVHRGFTSFTSQKRFLGPAGKNKHWHHIVEQS